MKKLLIVAVVFSAAFASCQGSKNIKSYTAIDSLSYASGIYLASNWGLLPATDSVLNVSAFAAAIQDLMNSKPQMTLEEASEFVNEWFQVRKPAESKAKNAAWLEEVKAKNPNIRTTETGLMYEIIDEGDMTVKAVDNADQVLANYTGTLMDGTEFDSGESTFALNGVIAGWTEGMKLVGKGGEIVLWVPAELAYAEQSRGVITPHSALKFVVKLIDVIPAEVTAE